MGGVPIRILKLCDADECAFNELLKDARSKSTIKELQMEYENWINSFTQNGFQNELVVCQNGITAYVDRDHMWFFPLNNI